MRLRRRNRRVAPVSKDAAAPWFETPRTRLRNLGRPNIAAPHHEAGMGRACVKLIGIRFSGSALQHARRFGNVRSNGVHQGR